LRERERNLRIAETASRDFQWEGQLFHEGDCVALLDGNIVEVADNPDDAISALRKLVPDPRRGMVVQVTSPAVEVIR